MNMQGLKIVTSKSDVKYETGISFAAAVAALLCLLLLSSGCTSIYYSTMEKFGKHKRDLLRDNVEELRDDQVEATQEFKDALTRLQELTGFNGGKLQDVYEKLNDDYERCRDRADAIKNRIYKIDSIAADLFEEWEGEIDVMSNPGFKRKSRAKLVATRSKYKKFHRTMKRSEQKLEPVLTALHDHVLYLKHNLNASAIAGLKGEVGTVEIDVKSLIKEMQASINEADLFIKTLPE